MVEEYKGADSDKDGIFKSFCNEIWASENKRRVFTKTIHFVVKKDLLNTQVGRVFDCWSDVEYMGYKAMSIEGDWCSLIRQKINNLYTRYFDKDVVLNKDYMRLLNAPKQLYYQWLNGVQFNVQELTNEINISINKALQLKAIYQKQKMELSWGKYKKVIETFLERAFKNCKLIEEYEKESSRLNMCDFINEDNFYIKYFCRTLECEMLKYQKQFYGVRDHKKYKRCKECGALIEDTGNKKMYCNTCAILRKKQSNKASDKKYKNKMRENRKT